MARKYDYNIVVIGAGAGGLVSAYLAAAVNARVALIEKNKMGGDCLNTGCVPSKALIRVSKALDEIRHASRFGIQGAQATLDFTAVMNYVRASIREIEPHDSVERYQSLGVDCFLGEAQIVDCHTVEVNGRTLSTKNIILATGASPIIPQIEGIERVGALDSESLWEIDSLPERLLVIGGGPVGCEMALAFSRLGSTVTQIERGSHLLGREDTDVSELITKNFCENGITVLLEHTARCFRNSSGSKSLVCATPTGEKEIEFDQVLLAVGRKARVEGFGLEKIGVKISKAKTIETDSFLRTSVPNVYVVGDAVGPYQFTHFAAHTAWYASINALFSPFKKFELDTHVIPRCTFTDPEVACVGLNEQEAREKRIPFRVTRYDIKELDRAISDGERFGFVKVISPPGKDRILGVTIVASHAGEMLAEFVLAMKHGLGLKKILNTIHSYPTWSEANKYVAGEWRKSNKPEWALKLSKLYHAFRRNY